MSTIEVALLPPLPRQRVLVVEFRTLADGKCSAVGGGPTDAEAIEYARESCPAGAEWHAVGWNDLYGE